MAFFNNDQMFCKVFLKNFLAILGKVLIFKVFRVESFFKVFFLEIGSMGFMGDLGRFFVQVVFPLVSR